jgi:hypothetical protein
MNGYGQLEVESRTLEGMTPEEKAALIRGEYLPDRLAEFRSTRDAEQQRLQGQLERVHGQIGRPIPIRGNNVGIQLGGMLAGALRDFGGMYLANRKEQQMADAKTASDAEFQNLIKKYGEDATGAGLETKRRGLSDAVRSFGRVQT